MNIVLGTKNVRVRLWREHLTVCEAIKILWLLISNLQAFQCSLCSIFLSQSLWGCLKPRIVAPLLYVIFLSFPNKFLLTFLCTLPHENIIYNYYFKILCPSIFSASSGVSLYIHLFVCFYWSSFSCSCFSSSIWWSFIVHVCLWMRNAVDYLVADYLAFLSLNGKVNCRAHITGSSPSLGRLLFFMVPGCGAGRQAGVPSC